MSDARLSVNGEELALETVVNPKHFTLRKTLVIRYEFPGAKSTRSKSKPRGRPHTWIMR